jgi:SAM-dependent methyltransferase
VTWSDPGYLRDVQYRTDRNLAARQSIYAYQHPPVDPVAAALDRAALRGDETVLDVGCGNGRYLAALAGRGHTGRVLGVDLSVGMLRTAAGTGPAALVAGDAAALPVRDGSVDVALAPHMLYHVPEPAVAVRELHRVTRPGGRVVVVLNAADHLRELRTLLNWPVEPLQLDAGQALLAAVFGPVDRLDLVAELRVPDAGPIEAYARSAAGHVPALPPGPYRIRTHTGVLVVRRGNTAAPPS